MYIIIDLSGSKFYSTLIYRDRGDHRHCRRAGSSFTKTVHLVRRTIKIVSLT